MLLETHFSICFAWLERLRRKYRFQQQGIYIAIVTYTMYQVYTYVLFTVASAAHKDTSSPIVCELN